MILIFLRFCHTSGGTEGEGEPEEPFLPEFQAAAKKCNYVKVREYKYVKGIVSLQVYFTNWSPSEN
jgi:hypothetical protein